MHDFNRLSISGFRRLESITNIEIRPLTVLIGVNGVGKTSFLDVISLLASSAAGRLNERLSDLGGLQSILTRGRAQMLRLGIEMSISNHAPLKYQIVLEPSGQSYLIASETLTQQSQLDAPEPFKHIESQYSDIRYSDIDTKRLLRPNWDHDPLETSLSQVPKLYRHPESMRKRLASVAYYAALNFVAGQKSPARMPQQMRPALLPGPTGEELITCLYYLRETNRDRFEIIEDTLMAAFPGFERLDFPPVAAGTLSLTWKDANYVKPIFLHELSEGTLRFLWLITLLQSPGLSEITLIDEPEVCLHPDLLRLLADLLRETGQRTQIIVATQSERLIRFLKPEEVLICDMVDGVARLSWADTLDLEKWLDDHGLDELWRMGRIGARQ